MIIILILYAILLFVVCGESGEMSEQSKTAREEILWTLIHAASMAFLIIIIEDIIGIILN